jgi:hypothetical protein
MKKLIIILFIPVVLFVACEKDKENPPSFTSNEIIVGTDQADKVYYSFETIGTHPFQGDSWDIEFSVPLQTAAIRINEGAGVQLYVYSNDTANWANVDTTGFDWEAVYNDKSDWLSGAFNQNATGGFNFGWGTYDFTVTHTVWGEYIFIIRLTDQSLKKLFIRKRIGYGDIYELRWADLDGSNQIDASFSPADYYGVKHFIQFSIVNNEVRQWEPDMDAWDLVFTRYMAKIPVGPGMEMDYPVMGVLLNPNNEGLKVTGIAPEDAKYTDNADGFSSAADVIGYDWKVSDPVTHEISLVENTSYFVKMSNGKIYQLYFTEYNVQATGTIMFKSKLVE